MLPFREFFLKFEELGDSPTTEQVYAECAGQSRRQAAYSHLRELHPNDVRYVVGYIEAYAEGGLYDDSQFQHCLDVIESGLQMPERDGLHDALRQLQQDVQEQRQERWDEFGPDDPPDETSSWHQFRSGDYSLIESRYHELAEGIQPEGITGGSEEQEYWALCQFMARIDFMRGNTEPAMARVDQYELGRVQVKLTPIPDSDLQECVLGCMAQMDIGAARQRVEFWLANSRMPIVSDLITGHPQFRSLFAL